MSGEDYPGRIGKTLGSVLLDKHDDEMSTRRFQYLVVAVHMVQGRDGKKSFGSLSDAYDDYFEDPHLSGQFRRLLEIVAHSSNPALLREHKKLNLNEKPEDAVNNQIWYLDEALSRFNGYSEDVMTKIKDELAPFIKTAPDGSLLQDLNSYVPCAYAFHEVMRRTQDLSEYCAP